VIRKGGLEVLCRGDVQNGVGYLGGMKVIS
jgi:hypothetical protein